MGQHVLLFIGVILSGIVCTNGSRLKNFCYFTNWSNKLMSFDARFQISDVNTTLCSHLIYAFAKIDTNNLRLVQAYRDDDNGQFVNKQGRYYDFANLKMENPDLKTLLSIGGSAVGSGPFAQIVLTPENMRLFSRNVAIYLRDRFFDGIVVDWEWPTDVYRDKFTHLLKAMRGEFEQEAIHNNKPRLLLTIAVAVGSITINESYNIPELSQYVDFIHILAYDFHGPWSAVTGFSAPLFSRQSDPHFNPELSQAWAVQFWIDKGAPPEKLVMGMTGLATTFELANQSDAGVGAPVLGPARPGPYLQQSGHVPYYRVCEMIQHDAVTRWDDEQKMAYYVSGTTWIGYGVPRSMEEKVRFAYSMNLGGVAFWSMDLDDFKGTHCNAGRYPLLTAVYDAIVALAPVDTTPRDMGTTTATPTTPRGRDPSAATATTPRARDPTSAAATTPRDRDPTSPTRDLTTATPTRTPTENNGIQNYVVVVKNFFVMVKDWFGSM